MTDEEGMLTAYQHGAASMKDRIRELEAALAEARMQSLADLGQAQDAYEAQKKAEAERDKLKSILGRYASGVGAASGIGAAKDVFFEDYGSLEKDEQALVRTLADIWED